MDDESNWWKQVLVGIGALLAVGALIGGIVAVISLKAADVAGITTADADNTSGTNTERPVIPRNANTPDTDDPATDPTDPTDPADTTAPTSEPPKTHKPKQRFELTISPTTASAYSRIDLTGTWPGHDGTLLQVQRKEDGVWTDFPTDATVDPGGGFHTYVETGHTGLNRFRMYDASSGKSSNVATVTIG